MQLERSRHLNAEPHERTGYGTGYAKGYKTKAMNTRVGEVKLAITQTRGADFYPQSLVRGFRSERALKLALAEMYVQGVSTRKGYAVLKCRQLTSAVQVNFLMSNYRHGVNGLLTHFIMFTLTPVMKK